MVSYAVRKTILRSCDWWLGHWSALAEESRAVAQITAGQEEQGVEPAFGFVPILNKNNLEISKCFMRLSVFKPVLLKCL